VLGDTYVGSALTTVMSLLFATSPLKWARPALIVVAAVVGAISAEVLRRRSPELWAGMGRHRGDA